MGNEKEVSEMLKGVAKLVLFGVVVTIAVVALVSGQVKKPNDPLADWAYPKAKRGLEGTNRPPLIWTKFTTTDSFEKVWDFYWQKVVKGAPVSLPPGVKSGTFYGGPSGDPKQQVVCAHYRDENPAAKVGVFVIREHQRTVSVTIVRRAKERETTIIVVLDQR
jgi:hypothetical protein